MTTFRVALVVLAVLVAGCTGAGGGTGGAVSPTAPPTSSTPTETPTPTPTETATPTPGSPAALDSTLDRLVRADDRAAFADEHGLAYRNGSVRVVIELDGRDSLPGGYAVEVEATHTDGGRTMVQGWVPVDELRPLAREDGVVAVEPPDAPVTAA